MCRVFQPRLRPFWLDTRAISLTLNATTAGSVRALSKLGDTLWPATQADAECPNTKGVCTALKESVVSWCLMYDAAANRLGGPGGNGLT